MAASIKASSIGKTMSAYRVIPFLSPRASFRACPRAMPTSSTEWWKSTSVSPSQQASRRNPPWAANRVSM